MTTFDECVTYAYTVSNPPSTRTLLAVSSPVTVSSLSSVVLPTTWRSEAIVTLLANVARALVTSGPLSVVLPEIVTLLSNNATPLTARLDVIVTLLVNVAVELATNTPLNVELEEATSGPLICMLLVVEDAPMVSEPTLRLPVTVALAVVVKSPVMEMTCGRRALLSVPVMTSVAFRAVRSEPSPRK